MRPKGVGAMPVGIGLALLAGIWLSTFLLQVPQHNVLLQGFAEEAHRKLVITNWIRTVLWSCRGILVLWMLKPIMREIPQYRNI
jgi:hypothetical protein